MEYTTPEHNATALRRAKRYERISHVLEAVATAGLSLRATREAEIIPASPQQEITEQDLIRQHTPSFPAAPLNTPQSTEAHPHFPTSPPPVSLDQPAEDLSHHIKPSERRQYEDDMRELREARGPES